MKLKKENIDYCYDKYITNPEFNKLISEKFETRLAQVNCVTKTDFDDKLINLNKKINSNKTKHLIVENELKKLETFNQSIFVVKVVLKMMILKII